MPTPTERDEALPHEAKTKLLSLQGQAADARDAAASAQRRIDDMRRQLNYAQGKPEDGNALEAEMDRLKIVREKEGQRHQELAALCTTIVRWLTTLPANVKLDRARPVKVELLEGEMIPAAIDRTRDEIEAAQNHLRLVRQAPLPAKDLKRLAGQYVAELAERGRPRVSGDRGELKISFADPKSFVGLTPDNMIAALAWFDPDALTTRLEIEIDALHGERDALSATEKEKRINELTANLDELERVEEAMVVQAQAQGIDATRRAMASPTAVLGVVIRTRTARVRAA